MDWQLNPAGQDPLHQQIVDQFRHQIATGKLKPGERLPAVRALAQHLALSVATVAKAYAELAEMGVIVATAGRGSFVAGSAQSSVASFREDRLRDLLGHAVLEALSLGYSLEQIEGALALQWARWQALRSNERFSATQTAPSVSVADLRIAGSHDLALEVLISQIRREHPALSISSSYVGSLAGLIALERGEVDVAGCHLLDEETGDYNLPFILRILPGEAVVLVNLAHRQQGLMVARGNPKGILGLVDLAREDITMVNRQRGAGTRVLLDLRLRDLHIHPETIAGYRYEVDTHTAVAAAIAGGSADVGLGILPAARAMHLDFIPIASERYDLAVRESGMDTPKIKILLDALRMASFQAVVRELGGYETYNTGKTIFSPKAGEYR